MSERGDLIRGALEMLILRTLASEPLHGYAIAEHIENGSDNALTIEEGSMYPALYRMEQRGWIEAEWGRSENNRKAKYYSLTPEGRAQLQAAARRWEGFTTAVAKVMA